METDIRQLLEELRDDHRNMAIVLDVLEGAVTTAGADQDPDIELVSEVMHYMTVYPDAVHHPKEDIVYAELTSRRPDLAEDLDDVSRDHREIADLGATLHNDADAIVAGAAVRREQFIADCGGYVQRLRKHMRWEEEDLFKRVEQMIDAAPATLDVEQHLHIKDPVFELEIESAFRRLVASLKAV